MKNENLKFIILLCIILYRRRSTRRNIDVIMNLKNLNTAFGAILEMACFADVKNYPAVLRMCFSIPNRVRETVSRRDVADSSVEN